MEVKVDNGDRVPSKSFSPTESLIKLDRAPMAVGIVPTRLSEWVQS